MHAIHPAQAAHAVVRRRAREAGQLIDDGSSAPDLSASGTGTMADDWGLGDLGGDNWSLPGDWTPDPGAIPELPDPTGTPAPADIPPDQPVPADVPPDSPPGWVGAWPPDAATQDAIAKAAAAAGQAAMTAASGGASAAGGAPVLDQGGGDIADGGGGGGVTPAPKTATETPFWTPTKIAVAALLGAGGVGLIVYFATRPKRRHNPRRRRR